MIFKKCADGNYFVYPKTLLGPFGLSLF